MKNEIISLRKNIYRSTSIMFIVQLFGALGAGLWAIPWLQANVASAFLSQLAVIGCYLAMIDFAFNGVIGSLQRCILQLRLNKMPIGAAALFIWILCLVVLAVCILTNILVLPF